MQHTLQSVFATADQTLRLPQSAVTVMELSQAEETEASQLVEAIQIDPTFVARLLRLANSPAYSRGTEVTEIDAAVSRLGFQEIGQLAIVMAAAKEFSKLESELLRTTSFWSHSLTTAVLARKKAAECGLRNGGIFVAGLLHDLGLPVEFSLCGESMIRAMDMSILADDISLLTAEQHVLGFSHPELGAKLCEHWNLPSVVVETVRHHHSPESAEHHREVVALVAWANVVETLGTEANLEEDLSPGMQLSLTEAQSILVDHSMSLPQNDELLEEAQAEAAEMLAMF
ncbi:MAG: HDOD domain-containing protein [Pseudomonadales bacterium]